MGGRLTKRLRRTCARPAYRRCSAGHHNHLVCRSCGRIVEFEGPAIGCWTDAVAAEHGFTQAEHQLEIFGRCRECTVSV
ncbi:MAG: Fur family transcriptional regulator [Janthinobacterium lividum]